MALSAEARARLDRHLDAVEAALAAAGNSRERRRGVVDDLEAQIQEMLAATSAAPTVEDVEAVLAKLDPPAAYCGAPEIEELEDGVGNEAPESHHKNEAVVETEDKTSKKRKRIMKPSVLVALVVCGMLLVMTPAVFDIFHERNVVALMSRPGVTSLGLYNPMDGDFRRLGFWLTGSAAIALGAIGGFVAFAREWQRDSRR